MTHPGVGSITGTGLRSGHWDTGSVPMASRSAATRGLFRVKTPVPGVGTSQQARQCVVAATWLGEAAQAAARCNPHFSVCVPGDASTQKNIAWLSAAMARKLAVRLYWMWRNGWNYSAVCREFGSHAGKLATGHGLKKSVVHLIGHPAPLKREFELLIMVGSKSGRRRRALAEPPPLKRTDGFPVCSFHEDSRLPELR